MKCDLCHATIEPDLSNLGQASEDTVLCDDCIMKLVKEYERACHPKPAKAKIPEPCTCCPRIASKPVV